MRGAWKNSPLYKRLVPIARRLDGKLASGFPGLIVGGNNVLYRHAQYYIQVRPAGEYARLNWGKPFGDAELHRVIDFVLLHVSKPKENFYLVPVAKAQTLSHTFPDHLNIAVDPARDSKIRSKIEPYKVTLDDVRRTLSK